MNKLFIDDYQIRERLNKIGPTWAKRISVFEYLYIVRFYDGTKGDVLGLIKQKTSNNMNIKKKIQRSTEFGVKNTI